MLIERSIFIIAISNDKKSTIKKPKEKKNENLSQIFFFLLIFINFRFDEAQYNVYIIFIL